MNPQRYVSSVIGSRSAQTTLYWVRRETQVVCGCFKGTLDEFEKQVKEAYPEGIYRDQYNNFIEICKYLCNG